MNSIGVELKNARMRKGLSLEEVSGVTRIPIRRLIDIECDDFSAIDSAFLYRSFTKQFAQCVDLDRSVLNTALAAATAQIPEPLVPGQNGARLRPDLPGLKPKRTHKLRWMLSVTSLAVMLGACSTLYELWENSRVAEQSPKNAAISGRATDQDSARNLDPPHVSQPNDPGAASNPLNIKLSVVENTWLSLAADGREVFKGTLRADESRTLEGRNTAQIRARNAGAVEIVFNGHPIGKIGAEGQMRTVVFTKDSYNVLHAQLAFPLAELIHGLE